MTAESSYKKLEKIREPYLRRAREAAELTIPSLVPPEGATPEDELHQPFQSLGSRGVNNLAAKLVLALFPPNSPFFKLTIDDFTLDQMSTEDDARAKIEKALGKIERAVMQHGEKSTVRVDMVETFKHLAVAGNALLFAKKDGGTRVFHLDQYVVKRAPEGEVIEIIVKEQVDYRVLSDDIRSEIEAIIKQEGTSSNASALDSKFMVDLYTHVERKGETGFIVHQEVKGKVIPGSNGSYTQESNPWIALRWTKIDGENYGRSFIEEFIGDMRSFEALSEAMVIGAAAMSKIIFLAAPNGTTSIRDLTEANSGDFVEGHANDVTVLQVDKHFDFRTVNEHRLDLKEQLSYVFMLHSAIQRNGERVTAEEIRFMAKELEDALGGLYSTLSQDLQLPLVNFYMQQLTKANKIPALPKGTVTPTVVTGIEALGRGNDLDKLDALIRGTADIFGPQAIASVVNVHDYMTRRATALGVDAEGLVKSEEQLQQEQQQAAMQQMGEKLGPNVINALSKNGGGEL